MRRSSRAGYAAALLYGASALAGCQGSSGGQTPPDGVLTVDVRPASMLPSGLTIADGQVQIDGLTVLGDVAPTSRSMIGEFSLDLTSTGSSFTLTDLPQGVYSRVRLTVDHVTLDGSWRGAPLHFAWETEGATPVDLRADGVEVTPGHDGELAVGVDAGSWFAGNILDGATLDGSGAIVVDPSHNFAIGATIASRVNGSFSLQDNAGPVQ